MMAALANPELVIETERARISRLLAGTIHEKPVRRSLFLIAEAAGQCADQAEAASLAARRRTLPFWRRLPTVQLVLRWS